MSALVSMRLLCTNQLSFPDTLGHAYQVIHYSSIAQTETSEARQHASAVMDVAFVLVMVRLASLLRVQWRTSAHPELPGEESEADTPLNSIQNCQPHFCTTISSWLT